MGKLEYSDFYRIDEEATKCNLSYIIRLSEIETQTIADYLNTSDRNVRNWRNGNSFPDAIMLPELASLLNVKVDDIYIYIYQTKRVMMDEDSYISQVKELLEQLLNNPETENKPLFNTLVKELCPINTYEELIPFLPYLEYSVCKDVLFRLNGISDSDSYFKDQMAYVWRNLKSEVKEYHKSSMFLMKNKFIHNILETEKTRYKVPNTSACFSEGLARYKELLIEHRKRNNSISDLRFNKQNGWS